MLETLPDAQLREFCRTRLETAERWLRRMVHEQLSKDFPYYLEATRPDGSRIIKAAIAKDAMARRQKEPARYPRGVDALLTDELVDIVCNPELFPLFRDALKQAYPDGRDEAHTFLKRLVSPRNRLAHANGLTLREAEQIVCYAGDVIDSLKHWYASMGLQNDYNVPTILRVTDSLGHAFERSQLNSVHDGGVCALLRESSSLRPGDVLTIEVEVDPSFDPATYLISWETTKLPKGANTTGRKVVIPITNQHVGLNWNPCCRITSKNDWHRLQGCDDFLIVNYRVLPPI